MLDTRSDSTPASAADRRALARKTFARLTALALIGGATACSLLLSSEPIPCSAQSDCAKFPGTRCDTAKKECVTGTVTTTPGDDGGGGGGGSDSSARDGTTPTPVEDAGPDAPPVVDGGDPCLNPNKPLVVFQGDVTENLTLTCKNDYRLVGRVVVVPPFTMTVAAGTTIYADSAIDPVTSSPGTLVIPPGARIVAVGEADKPVVFTSAKLIANPKEAPAAGDWGGIFVLGEAPVNVAGVDGGVGKGVKNGLGPWGQFGGNKPNNDSGKLSYVRIEYAGGKLPGNDDGFAFALDGVGDQTTVDHVQLRFSGDDCFEISGGTVNLKHVLCQYPYDDGIAFEVGWVGKVQFLVVQGRPGVDNGSNGLQGRSGGAGTPAIPTSNPQIYNATFCGQNGLPVPARDNQQYGIRLSEFANVRVANSVFMGWEATLDIQGTFAPAPVGAGSLFIRNSIAFGNIAANIAYPETPASGTNRRNPLADDDNGFDEVAFFKTPANQNSEVDPGIPKCFDATSPRFATSTPIGGIPGDAGNPAATSPPNDGFFDPTANYIGAFRDQNDTWANGRWVVWDEK